MTASASEDQDVRAAAYAHRLAAVRDGMAEADLEVVVAYAPQGCSFVDLSHVWWISGLRQVGPHAAVVIPVDGDPVLVLTPSYDARRAAERSAIADVYTTDDFAPSLRHVLDALPEASTRRVGVAAPWARLSIVDAGVLAAGLGARGTADASGLFSAAANLRDPLSIQLLRRASVIAEQGFDYLLQVIRPGISDRELFAAVDARLHELGADETFLPLVGHRSHPGSVWTGDAIVEVGTVFLAELSPSVEGEFSQICRTIVLTSPSDPRTEVMERYALLDAGLRAGLQALGPGVEAGTVVEAVNAPLLAAGYGEYARPPHIRTRGHALGLGATDLDLAAGSTEMLVKDMAFVIHPNQYLPESGFLMCGEPVLITENGSDLLSSQVGECVVLEVP